MKRWPYIASIIALSIGCAPMDEGRSSDGEAKESSNSSLSGGPVDYVILSSDSLAASAQRYGEYRKTTGHSVVVATMSKVAAGATDQNAALASMRAYIKGHYDVRDAKRPFFVLLVGDTDTTWSGRMNQVPAATFVEPSDKSKITTDNALADMNGDHIPDLALGRLAVSSDAEVDTVRGKIADYEQTYEVGPWNRRFSVFASTSGFGALIDPMIESVVNDVIERVPYTYDVTMTYAKQTSPYVYIPEQFSDKVYERINEGSLMVTYLGHGKEQGFADLSWNGRLYPILDTTKLDKLNVLHKSPILTFVACSTGSFDTGESISERILKAPNAPSAILSSTEISHPYASALFIHELAQAMTVGRVPTLGEAFVTAKNKLINNTTDTFRQKLESRIPSFLLPSSTRAALRRSHLYMYELFGDPAMKIQYPGASGSLTLSSASTLPDSTVDVQATLTGLASGSAIVTLETSRAATPQGLLPVPADTDPTRDEVIASNYEAANEKAVWTGEAAFQNGQFSLSVPIPTGLPKGPYFIKVYASDGSLDVSLAQPITVQ